ncbi:uncharacterized protein LOC114727197 [Neltuma alba]|uniref:uncharacterized protein LOC114727197 n=1 Tax=Neltuma alba TaxID=207710 RepID=UPI0010A41C9B|nr:uncharacterized protein LOC114727197 [Prosopis alba]
MEVGEKCKGEGSGKKSSKLEVELTWRKKEERKLFGGALVGKIISEKNLNLFHDLPLAAMEVDTAVKLGGLIGEVMMVEDPRGDGLLIRSFLRARVLVDLRKPLVTGMWSPRKDKDPIWIKAQYERLQNFYFACGRIGHDMRSCAIRVCNSDWEEAIGFKDLSSDSRRETPKLINQLKLVNEENVVTETVDSRSAKENCKEEAIQCMVERIASTTKWLPSKEQNNENVAGEGNSCDAEFRRKVVRKKPTRAVLKENYCVDAEKDDLSKALVVNGSISPMLEVTRSMEKIALKRKFDENEEGENVKRRRLNSENLTEHHNSLENAAPKKELRRSLRFFKKKSRQGKRIAGKSALNNGSLSLVTERETKHCPTNCVGDWPQSVTLEP